MTRLPQGYRLRLLPHHRLSFLVKPIQNLHVRELWNDLAQVGVQAYLTLLYELHDAYTCQELRHGSDPAHRVRREWRRAGIEVELSKCVGIQCFA